jgi:argininosuccinate lyase
VSAGNGRIQGELGLRTRRVVYGELTPGAIDAELPLMIQVDQAHLVMLAEQRLIAWETAGRLLRCLADLATDPRPLHHRPAPRGIYLMYEGYLIERLGAEVGGVLQSGRSRNDLKATLTYLRTRQWLLDFAEQATRLEAVLLSRSRAYQQVVMPVYTHFQAAMPVSYGYYLLGVARGVGRELDALAAAADRLRSCPLGAAAVAGTDLPINPDRTARLLGFERPTSHALDAVASRDVLLRLLAAAASLTVTLSRLATDLQLWSTVEFGFIEFPDRLVGGSSAMPQKRNAFLLEHLKAAPGEAVGAWTAAASTMAGTPFTNTIEVGTEATDRIWPGLRAADRAVLLAQVLVSGARPVPERMAQRAVAGYTTATTLANRLVRHGVPFRTAHRLVGEAVRAAVAAGSTDLTRFGPPGWLDRVDLGETDLGGQVRALAYGGGPGAAAEPLRRAGQAWAGHRRWHQDWRAALTGAEAALAEAVRATTAGPV